MGLAKEVSGAVEVLFYRKATWPNISSSRQNNGGGVQCGAIPSEGTLCLINKSEGNMVWPDATEFVYALIIKAEGMCDNSHGIPDDMGMTDVCYGFY